MITDKQRWLILKLMKEIEELKRESCNFYQLACVESQFDSYRITSKEASEDIQFLLNAKDDLTLIETDTEYEKRQKEQNEKMRKELNNER